MSYMTGFIRSKRRMLKDLVGYGYDNKRGVQVVAHKKKFVELELQYEVLRLTNEA